MNKKVLTLISIIIILATWLTLAMPTLACGDHHEKPTPPPAPPPTPPPTSTPLISSVQSVDSNYGYFTVNLFGLIKYYEFIEGQTDVGYNPYLGENYGETLAEDIDMSYGGYKLHIDAREVDVHYVTIAHTDSGIWITYHNFPIKINKE